VATTRTSRLRRFRLPVLLVSAAVAAAVLPGVVDSAAAAPSLSLSQAKAQVASLNTRAEKITESYNAARDSLGTVRKQEAASAATLAHDQRALTALQRRVGAAAAAAYRSGGLSATSSLVTTGSAQKFLDQTAGLEEVAQFQASEVAEANAAQRTVAAATVLHNAQIARQKALVAGMASKKHQVQNLLAAAKNVVARLTAAQQRALAAQQAAANRHAQSEQGSAPPAPPHSTYNGPATGSAATAVKYAYAQLGKPYVWGGAGPNSFDCSGLTMMAWNAAGVSLPHNAAMQQSDIPAVSLSSLQPGDLIFFGSPAFHVGMYIGGGNMIQAPHTGADVEITPVSYMSPSGAGRP
jgi:cell wall-associated NlpC family hydrolase